MLVESKKNKKAIRKNPLGRPKVTCTSPSNGGAKIQINTNSAISNLQQLLPKYNSQSSLKGLKTDIRRALGLPEKEGASDYGVFVIEDNGTSKECSIRISNHNANAGNYEGKESDTNISIKMRSRVNKNTFKPHKDIELMEYTYFDYLLMNVEQPIQKIILSIIEYLSNGIYNDKTGVALQNTSPQQVNNDTENNQEIKENRNMNKKQVIRLNESQLKQIVTESVKRVIREENDYYQSDNQEEFIIRFTLGKGIPFWVMKLNMRGPGYKHLVLTDDISEAEHFDSATAKNIKMIATDERWWGNVGDISIEKF